MPEPKYPYLYNKSEAIESRIQELMSWLALDVKSTLDEAVNRLYETESAKQKQKESESNV